jgi:TonB family protein
LALLLAVALWEQGVGRRKHMIDLNAPVIWADLQSVRAGAHSPGPSAPAATTIDKSRFRPAQPSETPVAKPIEKVREAKATPAAPAKQASTSKKVVDEAELAEAKRREAMQAALTGVRGELSAKRPAAAVGAGGMGAAGALAGSTQAQLFRRIIQMRIESNLHVTDYDWLGTYRERVVEYLVHLDAEGKIVSVKLQKSSGVGGMDQGVLKAIEASQPFYAPTEDLREFYAREGMQVRFSPQDLQR